MKTVLLIIESEIFGKKIQKALEKDFRILLCHDAAAAGEYLKQKPDGLILQMELPGTDGLSLLEKMCWKPGVIITLSLSYTPYVVQKLYDMGVGYMLRTPCTQRAVTERLTDMMKDRKNDHEDDQQITASHLEKLGISSRDEGGLHLRVAIPLFAQDPRQKLVHELYPAVATICGSTVSGVEHSMRRTIEDAWNERNPEFWSEYFPNCNRYPPNKVFISALAQKLYG